MLRQLRERKSNLKGYCEFFVLVGHLCEYKLPKDLTVEDIDALKKKRNCKAGYGCWKLERLIHPLEY